MHESIRDLTPANRWWTLLHFAVMAPSGHNTQPWKFRINGALAELREDASRRLPVVDPAGRELVISCGAALLNLRVAIHHFGLGEHVELLPDPAEPSLLARIHLTDTAPDEDETPLFDAMPLRRTNRFPFDPTPVSEDLLGRLEDGAAQEGGWMRTVRSAVDRRKLIELIAEADRLQASDPALREELAHWVRSNSSEKRDGVRGYSFGHGRIASHLAPLYVRFWKWGESQAQANEELAVSAPVLAVLGTDGDSRLDWLRAGQALGRVLLTAAANGVSASFFNQAVEVAEQRKQLAALIGSTGFPQLCFRLGHGPDVLPSPRRPIDEVIEET